MSSPGTRRVVQPDGRGGPVVLVPVPRRPPDALTTPAWRRRPTCSSCTSATSSDQVPYATLARSGIVRIGVARGRWDRPLHVSSSAAPGSPCLRASAGAIDRGLVRVRALRMTPNQPLVCNRYLLYDLTDRADPLCPLRDDAAVSDPVWGSLPGTRGCRHQQRGQLEAHSNTNG